MINYIKGELTDIEDGFIIVEAAGVGYGIFVPATVIGELPPIGTEVKIHTFYSVKEDGQSLFGFLYKEDREIFRLLISVSGIGPKGAIAILSVLRPDELRMAIITGDAKSISQAQGIGKRTAERVILELKDKIGSLAEDFVNAAGASGSAAAGRTHGTAAFSAGPVSEAIDALTVLGYSRMEAGRAVSQVMIDESMTTEDVLKLALKNINK
ncbi:MAG: Holliday junction branch migration protein RuvA [Eubacteriales bacterium]|nr:Holliday junction branch migration protein RuvA [Eubacteriales bacterium]